MENHWGSQRKRISIFWANIFPTLHEELERSNRLYEPTLQANLYVYCRNNDSLSFAGDAPLDA